MFLGIDLGTLVRERGLTWRSVTLRGFMPPFPDESGRLFLAPPFFTLFPVGIRVGPFEEPPDADQPSKERIADAAMDRCNDNSFELIQHRLR